MIKAWGVTDKGAVRQQNQDAYYLDVPSGGLAVVVVCDGMGLPLSSPSPLWGNPLLRAR